MPRMTTLTGVCAAVLAPFWLVQPATASDSRETIMLVLDASGSMRGRIGGETKMAVAKDRVSAVLGGLPAEKSIGLMAYGHRRSGDCGDIETVVSPAAGAAPQVVSAVQALRPRGKTPLAETVRRAADTLRYQSDPATVVLVTDGVESCGGDPCGLARALESDGIAFTAHVVGFGLTDKQGAAVSCVAENTGGLYLASDDADSLSQALTRVVNEPEPTATAIAMDDFDGTALGEDWEVLNEDLEAYIVEDGKLLTATATAGSLTNGEPANIFRWTGGLPEGDFDIAVDFTSEFQAKRSHVMVGLYQDPENRIAAGFYRDGSSNNELHLQIKVVSGGKKKRQMVEVASGSCCPRRYDMQSVFEQIEKRGARLVLQRRGRKMSARIELNGWTPNDKSPAVFTTDEILVLRDKGKPALHAGTWGRHYGDLGQTITFVDRFEVLAVE